MTRRIRWICGVGIVFALALFSSTATAAPVGELGTLLDRAAETLPSARAVELRLPSSADDLTALGEASYGVDDTAAISGLDDAKAEAVDTVDSAATEVGQATESSEFEVDVEEKIAGCAKEGFQGAAEDYNDASESGTDLPSFDDSFYYAARGCLADTFQGADDDGLDTVAEYLTGRPSEPAASATQVEPTALANWLDTTASDIGTEPASDTTSEPDPTPIDPSPATDTGGGDKGGGSSFPWWLLIVGVVALGGYGFYKSKQS